MDEQKKKGMDYRWQENEEGKRKLSECMMESEDVGERNKSKEGKSE